MNGRRGALVTLLLAGTLAMVPVQRALADAGTVTDFVPGAAVERSLPRPKPTPSVRRCTSTTNGAGLNRW